MLRCGHLKDKFFEEFVASPGGKNEGAKKVRFFPGNSDFVNTWSTVVVVAPGAHATRWERCYIFGLAVYGS